MRKYFLICAFLVLIGFFPVRVLGVGPENYPLNAELNVQDIFRGITAPLDTFFDSLSKVGVTTISVGDSGLGNSSSWNIGEFFLGLDHRFQEITGISVLQFLKAIIGIVIWLLNLFIDLFKWLFSLVNPHTTGLHPWLSGLRFAFFNHSSPSSQARLSGVGVN
ncbi:MAG: hypothetical protein AAB652_01980 [Patescibacteria group bacterium]